jgi:hypothetical protein
MVEQRFRNSELENLRASKVRAFALVIRWPHNQGIHISGHAVLAVDDKEGSGSARGVPLRIGRNADRRN